MWFYLLSALALGAVSARLRDYHHNGDLAKTTPVGLPLWNATYNALQSTIFMPCNFSGYFDAEFAASFGVADFDWSNGKQLWANTQPMTCEEDLIAQAQAVKAINPNTKVFVYRNFVKALPWFTSVREKIMDPAYSDWFLYFNPANTTYHVPQCDDNYDPPRCSNFYHDQDQTPEHPSGDGSCYEPCDCGEGVPCGEYLWNHANGTMLRTWLIEEFLLGPTGLGNSAVDGFYIDDGWADTQQPVASWQPAEGFCDHWITGGATEEDLHCVEDMGLTQAQVTNITLNWQQTMQEAAQAIMDNNGWGWYMFSDSTSPSASQCTQYFTQEAVNYNNTTLLFQWTGSNQYPLPNIDVDLATFMLIRGPYAWLGYSWLGCTSNEVPGFGTNRYTSPADIPQLQVDYGVPTGPYVQSSPGVFTRDWTLATVTMDCITYTPSITMK
jgi:hypothetical protein